MLCLLGVSLLLTALLFFHAPGLNGPEYWQWKWQRLSALRAFALTAAGVVPFFLGQYLRFRNPRHTPHALLLVCLSTFLLELACVGLYSQPFSLSRVSAIVESPEATSYYSMAVIFSVDGAHAKTPLEVLRTFPELMPSFPFHAPTKPPGPILFYYAIINFLGVNAAASLTGGLILGAVAVAGVPLTFLLLRHLLGDEEAAFHGASFFALCPGLILFFPQFDQVYPVFTCALVLLWSLALTRRRRLYAACFGLVLSLATFMSYTLLVLGLFLGAYTVIKASGAWGRGIAHAAECAVVGLLVVAVFYTLLWYFTGFDAPRTFATALDNQSNILPQLQRHYPRSVLWDLYDFALGTGWISFLLVGLAIRRRAGSFPREPRLWIILSAVGQILVVACSGLMQAETSRVWLFMVPLLVIPIGLELRCWRFPHRMLTYFCLWLAFAAIHQNMVFVLNK